ncbi:MAG: peptidase S10 [Acidobacteriia bacterium]|nr:peptidase S10 [Terriglobia bacterium]
MRIVLTLIVSVFIASAAIAQQNPSSETSTDHPKQAAPKKKEVRKEQPPPAPAATESKPPESATKPAEPSKPESADADKEEHYDVTEVPPVITHHQITLNGKTLAYTATAGRLPIKRGDGKIEAEMFFVAYTLDGQDAGKRPLTFSFNGGPGSASVWLHMGALGPKRVVLQPNGFMPAAPYRLEDNPNTLLDRSDIVMVDAMATGYSRAANAELAKKFLSVKGDVQAFGEFIRLYISRYDRWSSPLFLLGESYGTTRAAGIAGYLADHGIAFNGVTLLSMAVDFQTLEWNKSNDLPYFLLVPTFSMIAAYHHKLPADLSQDMAKTREEVVRWSMNDYALALGKGDALTPEEHRKLVEQLARYIGLRPEVVEAHNLRIDVPTFTHELLLDQKLRSGRLDGRFTSPDPDNERFYDPTSAAILPPYTSAFHQYLRTELNYKSDMPYKVFAWDEGGFQKWDWGSAVEGFPSTAGGLRSAMIKNPYMRILVMEGYYDLATPFAAADWTMDHLNLDAQYRQNISYATYGSGHMVYIDRAEHDKMKKDLVNFMEKCLPK